MDNTNATSASPFSSVASPVIRPRVAETSDREIPIEVVSDSLPLHPSVVEPPIASRSENIDRLLNVFIASTALVLASPVMLIVAGLIKLTSRGPIFYSQARVGINRRLLDGDQASYDRRARNLAEIVAGLNDLKTRAELAVKTGALVLVIGGDCAQVIGLLTGARRYHKHVNLLWFDRDADLNTPASTPSGRIDGMVVAHIIGKGAPELVRFWGEPPLVREPDVTLFGLERLDPPEQDFLARSPMRHV